MNPIRQRALEGLEPGERFSITRTFTRRETLAFGELTRDYNPVHYEDEFAAASGMDGLIQHGLLTAGMICEVGGQLGWLATKMEFAFRRPVKAGDTVTLTVEVTKVADNGAARAKAEYVNQHGEVVITAEMEGRLPVGKRRRALNAQVERGDPSNPLRD